FHAEGDIRGRNVTGVQTCALPISLEDWIVQSFGLRVFRKEVTAAQAQSSLTDFEKDLRDGLFQLRGLPDPIFERARQLSRQTTRSEERRVGKQWRCR